MLRAGAAAAQTTDVSDLLKRFQPTPAPTPYTCADCKEKKDLMIAGVALGIAGLGACIVGALKCSVRQRSIVANI